MAVKRLATASHKDSCSIVYTGALRTVIGKGIAAA